MFRVRLKFLCDSLNRVRKQDYSSAYLITKYCKTQTCVKCVAQRRSCKDVREVSIFSRRMYSHRSSKRDEDTENLFGRKNIILTVVGIGFIMLFVHVVTDEEFRLFIDQWIPGFSEAIKGPLTENDFMTLITTPQKSLWEMLTTSDEEKPVTKASDNNSDNNPEIKK